MFYYIFTGQIEAIPSQHISNCASATFKLVGAYDGRRHFNSVNSCSESMQSLNSMTHRQVSEAKKATGVLVLYFLLDCQMHTWKFLYSCRRCFRQNTVERPCPFIQGWFLWIVNHIFLMCSFMCLHVSTYIQCVFSLFFWIVPQCFAGMCRLFFWKNYKDDDITLLQR